MDFVTRQIGSSIDAVAPDGSEIRLLAAASRASMVHCTLPPNSVSLAVVHRTVEEIWHVVEGDGEVWRALADEESVVAVRAGTSLTLPTGVRFQFRNLGPAPLRLIIATMPPWPGNDEAVRVDGHWPVATDDNRA